MKKINKILILTIITLCILIGIKKSKTFNDFFYKNIYESNIQFIKLNNTYEKIFGSSLPFKNYNKTEQVFNEKITYEKIEPYLEGAKLKVQNQYLVPSYKTGLVLFIGEKENYGNTIIVSQNDGIDIWYANVEPTVKLYDYIKEGELIGTSLNDYIYIVYKKNGEALNYEEYLH